MIYTFDVSFAEEQNFDVIFEQGGGSSEINNQDKTVTPTEAEQIITYDAGYTGLGEVTVEPIPSEYIIPSGTKTITENGSGIDVAEFALADVNVPNTDSGSFTPEANIDTVNVTVTRQISGFLIHAMSSPYLSQGRTLGALYWDGNSPTYKWGRVGSNAVGSATAGAIGDTTDASISQSGNIVTLTLTATYKFIAGIEYRWIAW